MRVNKYDLVFYCDANYKSGFGHGSRCSKLASIIVKKYKYLKIGIKGNISNKSKLLIKKVCKDIIFIKSTSLFCRVAFIDKMFDYEDPNVMNKSFIEKVKSTSEKTIIMCSGTTIQYLDKSILYIGYQPLEKIFKKKNVFWGFRYSPTLIGKVKNTRRQKGRVFLALGGHKNNKELKHLTIALTSMHQIQRIDILLSPVNSNFKIINKFNNKNLIVNTHKNVKNLSPFLQSSELVITSFGNLTYESLAHNTPTIVVAQKNFQKKYAKLLERKKLVLALGYPTKVGVDKIALIISKFLESKIVLKQHPAVELNGIKNIANIINHYFD